MVMAKEDSASALSVFLSICQEKNKQTFFGGQQWCDGTMTWMRVRRSLGSRECVLAGQLGSAAGAPEHREGIWGSLVSSGLGDRVREARAGQWDAVAPLRARPRADPAPPL